MDLDFSLRKLGYNKDINVLNGDLAIKESVKNLIMTKFNERLFNYYIGTNINSYLFEQMDDTISDIITSEITEVLKNFESRISLNEISVYEIEEENSIEIEIIYTILENNTVETITKILTRDY